MARWAAFLGLTAVVLCLFLALARLSQAAVGDRGNRPDSDPPVRPAEVTGQTTGVPEFSTATLLANVALTQGVFGGLVAAGAWYFRIPTPTLGIGTGPLTGGPAGVGLGLAVGVVLWVGNEAAAAVADAAGATYDEALREQLAPGSPGGWLALLGIVLPLIAVVEEFLFRAAVVGAASAGLAVSPWILAVVSSVAFALGHGAQGRVGVVVTGALGFALAGVFVLSGSLLVVVVAHYVVNAVEFLVHEGVRYGLS
ncbi:MAG: CPBP family intramembrane glutamic endopeptidase [Salinirussus sp.]